MKPADLDVIRRTLIPVLENLMLHESISEDRDLLEAAERLLEWARSAGG